MASAPLAGVRRYDKLQAKAKTFGAAADAKAKAGTTAETPIDTTGDEGGAGGAGGRGLDLTSEGAARRLRRCRRSGWRRGGWRRGGRCT